MSILRDPEILKVAGANGTHTAVISAIFVPNVAIFVKWTGGSSPTAAITVEDTGDTREEVNAGTALWSPLTLSTPLTISGASGVHKIQLSPYAGQFLRVKVVFSAGSANLLISAYGSGNGS